MKGDFSVNLICVILPALMCKSARLGLLTETLRLEMISNYKVN